MMKRTIALLLALMLLLSLAACGSKKDSAVKEVKEAVPEEDAVAVVQGKLDSFYLGQANEDYMRLTGAGSEDCQAEFAANLEEKVGYFARYFDINSPSEETVAALTQLWTDIYAKSSYTVSQAELQEDGVTYAVTVEVRPLDIIQLIEENQEEGVAPYRAQYGNMDVETQEADDLWARCIIDLANKQLANADHLESQTVAIVVTHNGDGSWTIYDEGIYLVDDLLVVFP